MQGGGGRDVQGLSRARERPACVRIVCQGVLLCRLAAGQPASVLVILNSVDQIISHACSSSGSVASVQHLHDA